jgi:hypothetical protein
MAGEVLFQTLPRADSASYGRSCAYHLATRASESTLAPSSNKSLIDIHRLIALNSVKIENVLLADTHHM